MSLRDELLNDPEKLGYASLGDVAAADLLNKRNRLRLAGVKRTAFQVWAARRVRAVIEDAANDRGSSFRASALTLKDFLSGASDELDLTDTSVMELLLAWRAAGMVTQEEYDQLIAAGLVECSRAEELGLGTVHASQVRDAR